MRCFQTGFCIVAPTKIDILFFNEKDSANVELMLLEFQSRLSSCTEILLVNTLISFNE